MPGLLRLPGPMLARPGALPHGPAWAYEVKWDGFRALVSPVDGLEVRSRRGWAMTELVPELERLPAGMMLDGELVAWDGRGHPTSTDSAGGCCTATEASPSAWSCSTCWRLPGGV